LAVEEKTYQREDRNGFHGGEKGAGELVTMKIGEEKAKTSY